MGFQVGDKEAYRLMVGEAVGGVVQGQHGSQRQQQQQHQQKRLLGQHDDARQHQHQQQQQSQSQSQNQNLDQDAFREGEPPPRGNPYAALLQATKIELLETHKNPAVAKRCGVRVK